jgi:hypothetical protein
VFRAAAAARFISGPAFYAWKGQAIKLVDLRKQIYYFAYIER